MKTLRRWLIAIELWIARRRLRKACADLTKASKNLERFSDNDSALAFESASERLNQECEHYAQLRMRGN